MTEKPSVAAAIAAALGIEMKSRYGYVGKDYVISWCIGHLVTLAQPEVYNERYQKWNKDDLPILPDEWRYEVIQQTSGQYETLKELLNDPKMVCIEEPPFCSADYDGDGQQESAAIQHAIPGLSASCISMNTLIL